MMPRMVSTCISGCFYTRAIILFLLVSSSCCSVGHKCTPESDVVCLSYLQFLTFQSFSSHQLNLKTNAPVFLLRPYLGIKTVYFATNGKNGHGLKL